MSSQQKLIQWILETLQNNGWSISELARRAGVSGVAVTNVLNGHRNAGLTLCLGLAKATHTPPETVFRMADILPARSSTTDQQTEQELLSYFRGLDPGGQRALMTLARALHEDRAEYNIDRERENK